MKHLVVLRGVPYYEPVINKLWSSVPAISRIVFTTAQSENILSKIKYRPIFSSHYVIRIELDKLLQLDIVQEFIQLEWVQVIVFINDIDTFEMCKQKLKGDTIIFFNSTNASDNVVDKYIAYKLMTITRQVPKADIVKKIRNRMRFREYELESRLTLFGNSKMTAKDFSACFPKRRIITLSNFPYNFLMKSHLGELGQFLLKYRYSPRYLYQSLEEYFIYLFKLYDEYILGRLTKDNKAQWLLNRGKLFKITREYKLNQIFAIFEKYSYEKLLLLDRQIKSYRSRSTYMQIYYLYLMLR